MTHRTRRSPDRVRVGAARQCQSADKSPSSTIPGQPATLAQLVADSGGALRVQVLDMLDVLERPALKAPVAHLINKIGGGGQHCLACGCRLFGSGDGSVLTWFAVLTPARPDPHIVSIAGVCWDCTLKPDLRDTVLAALRRQWPQARWAGHVHEPPEGKQ